MSVKKQCLESSNRITSMMNSDVHSDRMVTKGQQSLSERIGMTVSDWQH